MGEFRMWINYQNGSTIGESGTENGNIIFDEEHVDGARITLEQNCHQNIPFAITSGIYGGIVHTTFASDKSEATLKYNKMKLCIEEGLGICKLAGETEMSSWVEKFCNQY